jgi:hypothetical protein
MCFISILKQQHDLESKGATDVTLITVQGTDHFTTLQIIF